MSYILEGLKKSEAERRQGAGPDLNALQAAPAPPKRPRSVWPLLLFSALLINALLLLWWLRPWQPAAEAPPLAARELPAVPAPAPPPAAAAPVAVDPAPAVPPLTPAPLRQAPVGWNDLPKPPNRSSLPGQKGKKEGVASIPVLQDLPADLRRQIPELAITLHYFTADPASRLARINGRIVREGEALSDRVVVERIAADTIIFRLGEIRFRSGEF